MAGDPRRRARVAHASVGVLAKASQRGSHPSHPGEGARTLRRRPFRRCPPALAAAATAFMFALCALAIAPPSASSFVDVSADLDGMLIESRGNTSSHVRITETADSVNSPPAPPGSNEYFVTGNPCQGGFGSLCSRVKPGTLLCRGLGVGDGPVFCPRTSVPQAVAPRVRVRFGNGDDTLSFGAGCCRAVIQFGDSLLSDPFRISARGGDDDIRAFISNAGESAFITSSTVATGPWTASLGAGDDRYQGSDGPDIVNGGAGDDVIEGDGSPTGGSADRIRGGSGNDRVDPGPGRDVVRLGAGADRVDARDRGPDSYDGGPGVDRISYRLRTRGITAGVAFTSAGARGEGDILRNFERVEGGRGPDRILGFMFGDGGPGNDVVTGGNRGRFFLTGGPGADTLRGFAGDDIINARDGQRDRRIECGAGFDTALLDRQDPAPVGGGCERVLRRG
jgi:hypothetical protein